MKTPPADPAKTSDGAGPVFPAKKVLGAFFSFFGVVLVAVLVAWWKTPVHRPDLSGLSTEPAIESQADAEQASFRQRPDSAAEPVNLTDHEWIGRLNGTWWIDLGGGPSLVVFGSKSLTRTELDGGFVEFFGASGKAASPYYTVFAGSESNPGHRFLAFQDEAGHYTLLLDDLEHHEAGVFSFRRPGSRQRSYAQRLESRLFSPFSRRDETLPDAGPPSEPKPKRARTADDIWQRAEDLRRQGRLDSLDRLLTRLLIADPRHRQARRWQRRLPEWKRQQRRELFGELEGLLRRLARALQDQDESSALELFVRGAREPTRVLLQDVARYGRLRPRIHLGRAQVEDGLVIFEATVTLESVRRRQRSVESFPWKSRMADGRFLDPLTRASDSR